MHYKYCEHLRNLSTFRRVLSALNDEDVLTHIF